MTTISGSGECRYGVVGDGLMATHVMRYFSLLGLKVKQWSRRGTIDPAVALAKTLGRCETVLILISDDAIERFIEEQHATLAGRTVIHFSGGLATERASGMHPLSTFGPQPYTLEQYRETPFVCDAEGPSFTAVFPDLPNPHFAIPRRQRPLYHSMCVLAGNFTPLLWEKLFETFSSLGLPRHVAAPYMRQVFGRLVDAAPYAHTGPVPRKDIAMIRKHLAALEGDPFRDVYRAMVGAMDVHIGDIVR